MSGPDALSLNEQAALGPVRAPERSQLAHLIRHFLERFFNHETASPDGDGKGRLVLIAVAVTVLFHTCPRRRQPHLSWLAFGSAVSVGLWVVVTAGLGVFFHASRAFGQTYGPLAGIVALMLWALLSAYALIFGAAISAQLEAVREGDCTHYGEEGEETRA